jgi:hypothetical protein
MQGIEAKVASTEVAWMIPSYTIGLAHLSNSSDLERAMRSSASEIIKCTATIIFTIILFHLRHSCLQHHRHSEIAETDGMKTREKSPQPSPQ